MNFINDTPEHFDQIFKNILLEPGTRLTGEFTECEFIQCSFEAALLDECRFSDCTFKDSNLSLAQIPGSSFSGTRFVNSKLIGIDWTKGNWSSLGVQKLVGFSDCVISHSTFIGLELKGLEINNCIAHEVDFREANLSKANFAGTDLDSSLFGNTNLTEADLSQARNYRIDPGANTLLQARFALPEALALLHSMHIELVEANEL